MNDATLRQALATISVPSPRDARIVALELIDYAAKIEDEIAATKAPIGGAADCAAPVIREAAAILADRARAVAVPVCDPDVQSMRDSNAWHNLKDVRPVLDAAKAGTWQWFANTRCKYIELRIDMRDGGCIIMDRERIRISPETLAYQYGATPAPAPADAGEQANGLSRFVHSPDAERTEIALRALEKHDAFLRSDAGEQAEDCAYTVRVWNAGGSGEFRTLDRIHELANGTKLYDRPADQVAREPLTEAKKSNMWVSATIEFASHENCYLRGITDAEAYHGIVPKEQAK